MLAGTFLEKFPWIRVIDGVELFFVLSGFLIGGILIRTIHKSDYHLSVKALGRFWKRRWFRTLPNYYLILLVNILLVEGGWIDGDISQLDYRFFLFLQNFSEPFYDFFWESWSLSIEEWFYLFLPVGIWIALKISPTRKSILAVILFLIFLPLLIRILRAGESVDPFWWDVKFRKLVLLRLDTIIYGVLAAYVKFYHNSFWRDLAYPAFLLGISIILISQYLPWEVNGFFAKTFYFNCTTIGAMLLLPLADSWKRFRGWGGRVVTHISLISYSMYLVNLGVVSEVIKKQFPIANPMDGALKYMIYWVVVIVLSSYLYYIFEQPIMDLRDRKWNFK